MKQENQIQEQQGQQYMSPVYPPYYEDEISLVDLWLVLVKRKRLILKVFLVFIVLAIALAFIKKDKYEYITTFEIGQIASSVDGNDSYTLVEPVDSVKAKLENSYLPSAQARYYANHPDAKLVKVSIESPKKAQMLIVKSKGIEKDADTHKTLHNMAVNPLLEDLNRKVESSKKKLEARLTNEKFELARMQNPVFVRLLESKYDTKINEQLDAVERLKSDVFWLPKIKALESRIAQEKASLQNIKNNETALLAQRKRLDELEALMLKQFERLNAQIDDAQKVRRDAVSGVTNESGAMTILLLDSEMERLNTRRGELEERIYINHKNNIVNLENKISENQQQQKNQKIKVLEAEAELIKAKQDRDSQIKLQQPKLGVIKDQKQQALIEHKRKIEEQKETVGTIEASINSMTESHVIVPFLQSAEPKGLTSKLLFVLVIFVGFIFAVIAAFVAEFMAKAREKMHEEGML